MNVSPVDGHLDGFQFLAIMNKAAAMTILHIPDGISFITGRLILDFT